MLEVQFGAGKPSRVHIQDRTPDKTFYIKHHYVQLRTALVKK